MTVKGTNKEAERKLAEFQHTVDKGIPINDSKITLKDYLATWLRDVVALRDKPRTIEGYTTIVNRHFQT